MIQANFFKDSRGFIEVTKISKDYMEKYHQNREYICSRNLSESEWERILNFEESDSQKISEFLQSEYLQFTVQSRIHSLLSHFDSQLLQKTRQFLKIAA